MKILHISFEKIGGAGIAASRINLALNKINIKSEFLYYKPFSRDVAKISRFEKKILGLLNVFIIKIIKMRSINIIPTPLLGYINTCDADIVHLHWINNEMISIKQISKINKPLIWTFHDMWAFCGSEHYTTDDRYKFGYSKLNKKYYFKRYKLEIDNWVFERKKKYWAKLNLKIVCPSKWLSDCVTSSLLFKQYQTNVIPNCIDLSVFKPLNSKIKLRKKYNIPPNKKVILFGASVPGHLRKGGDLLDNALIKLKKINDYVLVVFGSKSYDSSLLDSGFKVIVLGSFSTVNEIVEIYNLADVMCVPSRQEAFGQTASEPLACGLPVVAFNTTGLVDVVDHKVNGYLAKPFDLDDFKNGIEWILGDNLDDLQYSNTSSRISYDQLKINARKKAEQCFEQENIAYQYAELYKTVFL